MFTTTVKYKDNASGNYITLTGTPVRMIVRERNDQKGRPFFEKTN